MEAPKEFADVFADVMRDYGPSIARRTGESPTSWMARLGDADRHFITAELLLEHCPIGGLVADLGAWPGQFTACLQRMGWSVIGVDKLVSRPVVWSPTALLSEDWLQTQAPALSFEGLCTREGVTAVNADIETEALPFSNDSLDAVVLTEVIEHLWRDPLFALGEINRVLKLGTGRLILSTPNFLSLKNRIEFLFGRIDQVLEHPFVSFLKRGRVGHMGHMRLYAPNELLGILQLLGFECTIRYERIGREIAGADGPAPAAKADGALSPRSRLQVPARVRRLIKSPRNYANAVAATLVEVGEKYVPHLRGRMFIVGTKTRSADFDRNYPDELKRLVTDNVLA